MWSCGLVEPEVPDLSGLSINNMKLNSEFSFFLVFPRTPTGKKFIEDRETKISSQKRFHSSTVPQFFLRVCKYTNYQIITLKNH